ncbi:MAG: FHA domain-containing protein [Heteroscytonema crispum UTEX LB 1556]
MNALTLQWHDAGQDCTYKIYEQQPSKNLGTVRIGRDPVRCDILVSNPTVSGLHVEIFFNPQHQCFLIRNLREQNPPLVDGQQLVRGEQPLSEGSIIYLGQMQLKVIAVSVPASSSLPATILVPPPPVTNPQPPTPVAPPQPQPPLGHHHQHSPIQSAQQQGVYGLECPKCHKVSSTDYLQVGCPWCGTSLAAAVSVLVIPKRK